MANGTQTAPDWSTNIGTKSRQDIDTQARKELAAGHIRPEFDWPSGTAYTAWEEAAILGRMRELVPELDAYYEQLDKFRGTSGWKSRKEEIEDRLEYLANLSRYFSKDINWVTRKLIEEEGKRLAAIEAGLGPTEIYEAPTVGEYPKPEPKLAGYVYPKEAYQVGTTWQMPSGGLYPTGVTPAAVSLSPSEYIALKEAYGDRVGIIGPAPEPESEYWYKPGKVIPLERSEGYYEAPTRLPIPSWMGEFLETSMGPAGEAGRAKGAYAVRPFGAQLELPPEKLARIAGYLGWTKAGAPLRFSEDYLRALEQLPEWWEEHAKLSEKLFPKAVRMPKPTWQATYQR